MSQSPAPRRNPRIEALRLVAIAGIAVFHTLLPWFDMAQLGWWVPSAPVALILGVVSLLGAFGNHVFFLVSGLFLLPRAADASEQPGYWHAQARSTARRALVIVLSVALYAAAALAVSAWVTPVPGVSLAETGWLVGGLEFIWVYLVVIAICPVIGWAWRRLPHVGGVTFALVACVFAVNAYIAFVSPGEEERFEAIERLIGQQVPVETLPPDLEISDTLLEEERVETANIVYQRGGPRGGGAFHERKSRPAASSNTSSRRSRNSRGRR